MISDITLEDAFPYEKARLGQLECVHEAYDAFNNGKHYVLLDAGTGFGKSGVARTLADYCSTVLGYSTFLLTNTKMLQDQYDEECSINKFGVKYNVGKGRSNFYCILNDKPCTEGECKMKQPDDVMKCPYGMHNNDPINNGGCPYWVNKASTIQSDVAILNYNVLLSDLAYVGHYGHRELMIADEAHNIENKIMGEITISLTESSLNKMLDFKFSDRDFKNTSIKYWLDRIEELILNARLREDNYEDFGINQKDLESLKSMREGLEWKHSEIENNPTEWVVCPNPFQRNISIKPIKISKWTVSKLFDASDYHLLMSGTFIDYRQYCSDLGIDLDDVHYIKAESSFDMVRNNPVKECYVGSMSFKHKNRTLPKTIPVINKIMKAHEGESGLIHAHSREFSKYIMQNIDSDRLMTYDEYNKTEQIKIFEENEDKVMVSYSLQEGLNLPYDGIRFQVFYKVPYPFLGDNQIKARMEKDPNWYNVKTVQTIIQSWGRGMRAEDDYCMNYLLDKSFQNIVYGEKFRRLLPDEFKEAVLWQGTQSTLV